jgi:hypothetical protein
MHVAYSHPWQNWSAAQISLGTIHGQCTIQAKEIVPTQLNLIQASPEVPKNLLLDIKQWQS